MSRRRRRDDRGSATLELVALLPVHMMFIVAVVFIGKVNNSAANVEAAARSAARTMSFGVERDVVAAAGEAETQAADMVDAGGSFCTNADFFSYDYDPGDPPGDPGQVTVTINCTVDLSQATGLGFPGSYEVESEATEVIDPYREQP
ncbi:MAG TPA: TadE family protein [Acidimicrobiales bacterium]